MDAPHRNYDPVFKEALSLFKDKALDFLGLTDIAPITEPLRTESVEIEIKNAFSDLTFGTQDGLGLHLESEVDLSKDDMLRFGGYNLWLSRTYKREFITVIFLKNPSITTEVRTRQVHFMPTIVQCSNIDADEMLYGLQNDIANGKSINELKLVYLPLFRSIKFNPTELFEESTKLIKELQVDDDRKKKIYALSIVLAGKVVDAAALEAAKEEVLKMGNVIIEVVENWGKERQMEETARKMLTDNFKLSDIIKYTDIDIDRLDEIRKSMNMESLFA